MRSHPLSTLTLPTSDTALTSARPSTTEPEAPRAPAETPWADSNREDLIVLLDHFTGNENENRWKGFSHAHLEALLNHHDKKNAEVTTTGLKRERATDHGDFVDAGGVEIVEERPVKHRRVPTQNDDVIVLE
ncbi:hypothetical protein CC80DRAFT_549249 [Byssothecium circinans]|uniref:Uncharacterized protein n=1 Tax=Byssothecium circinans TaxID=147558 RepID=A0A6A5TV88_9PLEO|nr:hypothetical protein CC80DRAFT_549249 [Byssothecium circinans]